MRDMERLTGSGFLSWPESSLWVEGAYGVRESLFCQVGVREWITSPAAGSIKDMQPARRWMLFVAVNLGTGDRELVNVQQARSSCLLRDPEDNKNAKAAGAQAGSLESDALTSARRVHEFI